MSALALVFEDESLTGFRPLAWSQPVGELRCGVLNLRERLAILAGRQPALLLRDFLGDLALAHGHAAGLLGPRQHLAAGGRLMLVSGRVGAAWDLLEEAWSLAAHQDLAWRDDCGWLVLAVGGDVGQAILTSWEQWQRRAHESGCWRDPSIPPPRWDIDTSIPLLNGGDRRSIIGAFRRIWDLVPATAAAIAADMSRLGKEIPARRPWGVIAEHLAGAQWAAAVSLQEWSDAPQPGVHVKGPGPFLLGPNCELAFGVAVDTTAGPVLLGRDVQVMPHCYLEGPLYLGSGSLVKSGTAIYGETSLGAVSKIAGEIAESTLLDMVNKQHEGFIGHSYIGSWCNLGALTTCSDLKNTYGSISVDLGNGPENTGQRFIGLLMGEHCKTAIGTLFNTAACAGFASNVFGCGFSQKTLPNYTWGDGRSTVRHEPGRALATARAAMSRRGCRLTTGHEKLFRFLAVPQHE